MNLSQDELAYLLACRAGAKISRYEHFHHEPSLRTAMACSIVFQVPVEEIFAGLSAEIEQNTIERIRLLARKVNLSDPARVSDIRRKTLVVGLLENHPSLKRK